jgi:Arc/MetJ-type ribon-helix-helix transcriptional regulator
MTITLTPEVQDRIQRKIESGHYPDAEAVIVKALAALAALEAEEQARFEQDTRPRPSRPQQQPGH